MFHPLTSYSTSCLPGKSRNLSLYKSPRPAYEKECGIVNVSLDFTSRFAVRAQNEYLASISYLMVSYVSQMEEDLRKH